MTGLFVHCHPFIPLLFFSCPLRRHSSEGSPAWMRVVERRLEQAAEESRKAESGCETDCDFSRPAEVTRFVIPALREWIIETTGFRPSPE